MKEYRCRQDRLYCWVMPATVTLSAAGLASAGEGVAAAALEAAAGGLCGWRVKPPPGWRSGNGGQDPVVCNSAAEAARFVLSSSDRPISSENDDDNDDDASRGGGGKWFLQQRVEEEGKKGGVFEVCASVLVVGALRIDLHRHVEGLEEAISKSSPSGAGASNAAARTAIAYTIREAITTAARNRRCFLPFPNCFEVFSARMLLTRKEGDGSGDDDGDGGWRAWLLRLDDTFAENKGSGHTSSSSLSSGHSLDALAADAVTAAAEAFSFSVHVEEADKAFDTIYDSSSGGG